jgi:hypothetical protein
MSEGNFPNPLNGWAVIKGPDDEAGMRNAIWSWQTPPDGTFHPAWHFVLLLRERRNEGWECGLFTRDLLHDNAVNVAGEAAAAKGQGKVPVLSSGWSVFEPRWHRAIEPKA